jgi:polypeptide N-acetylgalactosaminyltransferase
MKFSLKKPFQLKMRRNTISFLRYVLALLVILLITASLLKSLHIVHDIAKLDNHKIPAKFANFLQPQASPPIARSFFDSAAKNVDGSKIDWHDYEMIAREEHRKGLGEHGLAAKLSKEEKALEQKLFMRNGFNALLSDKISLNRSIPDIRHKDCHKKKYLRELPNVSVIFPFFNEHWSTLLRSIYSILNRSPPHLLKEIILVDDSSEKSFLNGPLDRFVAKKLPKVKLVHLQQRSGLIKARLAGAAIATADVLLFLDSHIEANVNWLPPLLGKSQGKYLSTS